MLVNFMLMIYNTLQATPHSKKRSSEVKHYLFILRELFLVSYIPIKGNTNSCMNKNCI